MKTVCAASVLFGQEAFETLGEVVVVPDREITHPVLRDADALIIRSKTPVQEALLEDTPVVFVGTATAGMDHLDVGYLNEAGVAWSAAPGCNANSVAEYVITAILALAHKHGFAWQGKTLGIIGVGEVGGRLARKASGLGMRVLRNDPPLALKTGDPAFLPLEEVLKQSDIISLHVPLERQGPFPTWHLADCRFFGRVKPGVVFINASRGEVVDPEALLYALDHGAIARTVLDVWENEPEISKDLVARVDVATPHIAGYSFDGRLKGTREVYREACHFFEVDPTWEPDDRLFPHAPTLNVESDGDSEEDLLARIVMGAYPIEQDDAALRAGLAAGEWGRHFEALRRRYAPRREFPATKVRMAHAAPELLEKIAVLEFQVAAF